MKIVQALRVLLSRVGAGLTRRRRETELGEEIQAHLDLLIEENLRSGCPWKLPAPQPVANSAGSIR